MNTPSTISNLFSDLGNLLAKETNLLRQRFQRGLEKGIITSQLVAWFRANILIFFGALWLAVGVTYLLHQYIGSPLWVSFCGIGLITLTTGIILFIKAKNTLTSNDEKYDDKDVVEARSTLIGNFERMGSHMNMNTLTNKVKDAIDLEGRVEKHPLAMAGGAILTGFVIGNFVSHAISSPKASKHAARATKDESVFKTWLSKFQDEYKDEIKIAKNMAILAGVKAIEKKMKEQLPDASELIGKVAHQVENKLA